MFCVYQNIFINNLDEAIINFSRKGERQYNMTDHFNWHENKDFKEKSENILKYLPAVIKAKKNIV